ncbi:hypothetical protein GTS_20190 [Gandjariella thermophila]|uniref:Uncharacterized protein n=1 Tax=Gandjariella thermophila TaxID=1931992 RepID=A0A4D4J795_9PSEU|nr:hypothetical protein GTS_20190 [Gandjariella thermophila]
MSAIACAVSGMLSGSVWISTIAVITVFLLAFAASRAAAIPPAGRRPATGDRGPGGRVRAVVVLERRDVR